jgi:hypothetical protein
MQARHHLIGLLVLGAISWLSAQNVGIGTSLPQARLHIQGAEPHLRIENPAGGRTVLLFVRNNIMDWDMGTDNNGVGNTILWYGDGTAYRMVLEKGTGHVGIGTTTPEFILHVNRGNGDNWIGSFQSGTDGSGNRQELIVGYNSVADYGYIQGHHANIAWTNLILQRYGGNVGIGTTAPAQRLHVAGTIRSDAIAGAHPASQTYSLLGTNTSGDIRRVNPTHGYLYTYVVTCDFTVEGTIRSQISGGNLTINCHNEGGAFVKTCANFGGVQNALVHFLIVNDDVGNCPNPARVSGVRSFTVTDGGGLVTVNTDLGCNGSDGNNMIFFIHYNPQ